MKKSLTAVTVSHCLPPGIDCAGKARARTRVMAAITFSPDRSRSWKAHEGKFPGAPETYRCESRRNRLR